MSALDNVLSAFAGDGVAIRDLWSGDIEAARAELAALRERCALYEDIVRSALRVEESMQYGWAWNSGARAARDVRFEFIGKLKALTPEARAALRDGGSP